MIDFEKWKGSLIVLGVLSALLFGLNLSSIGIWEPWEANEFLVGQEYATRGAPEASTDLRAPSYNAVVPTLDSKPVGRSLLKVWLLALTSGDLTGGPKVGHLEFWARLPFALALWLLVIAQFFWVRRRFSTKAALFSGLIFGTFPVIFIAAHNLATEVLFLVTTSLAFMSWFELVHDEANRKRWLAVFGVSLVLVFLDQRLFGVLLVLLVLAVHALSEMIFEEWNAQQKGEPSKIDYRRILQGAVAAPASLAALWWAAGDGDLSKMNELFVPHKAQIVSVLIPLLLALGMFWAARKTRPGSVFWREGLVAFGATALLAAGVGHLYGAANPTLLQYGEVTGKIPVLTFFLEHQIFGSSLVLKHMSFDLWVRQIGFAIVPWVGIVPLGLAYLGRATRRDRDDLLESGVAAQRLVLVWAVFCGVFLIFGAIYNHYFYPAYLALAIGAGVMFADDDFWKELQLKPLALYAMGFFAVAAVMMVGKDLERFPARFVEVYTVMQEKLELEDDFSFGRTMKLLKYGMMGILMLYFFGIVSWFGLTLKKAPAALLFIKSGPKAWWRTTRDGYRNLSSETTSQSDRPFEARSVQKAEFRQESGLIPKVARLVENSQTFGIVLLAFALLTALVYQTKFLPDLTNHMSQRGVFETFQKSAESGSELYRYDIQGKESSVYLQDLPSIENAADFKTRFKAEQRLFAVIPRDALARINQDVRRDTKQNLAVLDARSSRLLLVSNKLLPGEEDHNFVAQSIFEDDSAVQQKLAFDDGSGGTTPPKFDEQLEMIGVSYDKPPDKDGLPSYRWGEVAVIDYYFRVLKRVPGNQKIFLHVDTPGNRINGDHFPNDGAFPTNQWLPGDIVRSRQHLTIENYSTPGVYNLNFGFFVGSTRMKVTPRKAHDGQNRVTVGKIRVTSL